MTYSFLPKRDMLMSLLTKYLMMMTMIIITTTTTRGLGLLACSGSDFVF
jgi:hypothetical protein